jgi:IS1 family transposase
MKLAPAQRVQILNALCEGNSMRGTARLVGVSLNTVLKMLRDCGEVCLDLHDALVTDLKVKRCEVDELWSFVHTRAANLPKAKIQDADFGDCWTWTALDADSKLMISYLAGQRSAKSAEAFTRDLASRVVDRIQVTSDGFPAYAPALQKAFNGAVDHAMLVKVYANVPEKATRYAPLEVVGTKTTIIAGSPDKASISTSYVERMNLSIRMQNKRFARLTNAHSKKYAHHLYSFAIYIMFYNFIRRHQSLGGNTPAMAAGISTKPWTFYDVIARMDAVAPKPGPKGPRVVREVRG